MAKKRLGRGLDVLISPKNNVIKESKSKKQGEEIKKIPLKQIKVNPYQPRSNFDSESLDELGQSIKEHGLIQPIILRPVNEGYQIVAGERRYRATKKLGFKVIEAIILEFGEQEMLEVALIENLQRDNLNPLEEGEAYQALIDKFSLSQGEVAKRVGKSRSAISNTLRLLKLPDEIKKEVSRENISMGHARALLSLDNIDLQKEITLKIIEKELTVRETERLVKEVNNSGKKKANKKKNKDPNLIFVEDKLRNILGTPVNIQNGKNKGKIVIEYYSNDDLARIVELLNE
ncbi:ParB/RepB/Spo0J family partition protein [Halonatronum saccharophilum]|uniref:ParB/RepB/Spo0J family partition protein n=1 Tax=Halonatronum saccharophilum TaxID=150060 RepID=UPI00048573F1|nr:ParB/RepB/Spo0J family partition protein [Halonatronum saccharophilum]